MRYLIGEDVNDELCNLAASVTKAGSVRTVVVPPLENAASNDESRGVADYYASLSDGAKARAMGEA